MGNRVGVKIVPEEFLLRGDWGLKRNRHGLFVPDINKKGFQLGFMVNQNQLDPFRGSSDRVVDHSGIWMGIVVEQIEGFSRWRRGLEISFMGGVNLFIQNDGGVIWRRQGGYLKNELVLPRGVKSRDLLKLLEF